MHTTPSEASILRTLLEKVNGTASHNKERLREVLGAVVEGNYTVLQNRKLPVDQQILAFIDILSRIRKIVEDE